MKKRRIFGMVMAAVMALSLGACGNAQTGNEVTPTAAITATTVPTEASAKPTTEPTATPVPQPQNVTIADASITFEDGNMEFVKAYMEHARSADVELSIVDYNGSKALQVVNKDGAVPFIAFDISSLLGANIANVAGVEMVIGTSHGDGEFYAVAGEILSWYGEELAEAVTGKWSIYMEKKNPKITAAKIPAGNEFVADANNIMMINLKEDLGISTAGTVATFYIDDVRFYDAAGNTITADTSVAFVEPEGFSGGGADYSNLYLVQNEVVFPDFATSANGWVQNGFDIPQEIMDALVPGSVIEISYTSDDGSMWIVMPDAKEGWTRVGDGNNGASYRNNSSTVAQITYEQIAQFCGADKSTWGGRLQCEAGTAWEVYSVKVGTAVNRIAAVNAVEFPDFVTSAAGWVQNGFNIPQEILDALVPGSVIEIDYTSEDGSMWVVIPDGAKGWMRVGDGNNGKSLCVDGKCYITYEMLAQYCGEDKSTWGGRLQCEAGTAWEVFGLRVGTKAEFPVLANFTNFDGFATSANGWVQNGFDFTPEFLEALVPGSVIEISYTSEDGNMWVVIPDGAKGWMRVGDGNNGKSLCENGICYVPYEMIAQYCGEDKSTWGGRLQCEAGTAWEVYSVRVGQSPVQAVATE